MKLKYLRSSIAITMTLIVFASVDLAQIAGGLNETTNSNMGGIHYISGTVFWPSGTPVNTRMRLKLVSMGRGEVVSSTDDSGRFVFSRVSPGSYSIVIDREEDFDVVSQTVDVEPNRTPQTYSVSVRLVEKRTRTSKPGVIDARAPQGAWTSWDRDQLEKVLNDSPWGKTQTGDFVGDIAVAQTTARDVSALKFAGDVKYRVRLFSARPVREAFARVITLMNPKIQPDKMNGFIEEDYSEWIVVAMTAESVDRRPHAKVGQKFVDAILESFKGKAYIQRGDGKQLAPVEYLPPGKDGTGAKFFFPKKVDGKPWLQPNDTLLFYADFGSGTKIIRSFRLSEMQYGGNLEY